MLTPEKKVFFVTKLFDNFLELLENEFRLFLPKPKDLLFSRQKLKNGESFCPKPKKKSIRNAFKKKNASKMQIDFVLKKPVN